jgi:hypothetical protein
MFVKMIKAVVFGCLLVLLSVALVFSDNPAYWNRSEGANGVAEYAYDSGSFALEDGFEFTTIYVSAKLQNGQSNQSMMTAEAHIEVGSWVVHAEAAHTVTTLLISDSEDVSGTGSCDEWYWMVDTRNNDGTGSAWCRWRWNEN